jgi:hypothetical protein
MADQPTVHDLKPDPENANRGTARGRELLTESIDTCGYGRGVVADRHLATIAGNKTADVAKQKNAKVRLVPTDGTRLVVIQRTDLDLRTDPKARQLSYYDNRASEVGLSWDADRIQLDRASGVDLTMAFFPEELSTFAPVQTPAVLQAPAPSLPPEPGSPHDGDSPTERSIKAKHNAKKRHERGANDYRTVVHLPLQTVEARANWTAFHKRLKARYPELERPGDRFMRYLQDLEGL